MSYKKRTAEETESILREYAGGASIVDLCEKYSMSQSGFYRLLLSSRGIEPKTSKQQEKIKRLEKKLQEREREISLLRNILKKS